RQAIGGRVGRGDETDLVPGPLRPGLGAALAQLVFLAERAAGNGYRLGGGRLHREPQEHGREREELCHDSSPSGSSPWDRDPWSSTRAAGLSGRPQAGIRLHLGAPMPTDQGAFLGRKADESGRPSRFPALPDSAAFTPFGATKISLAGTF